MHYLGLLGVPRRYHELGVTAFIPDSAHTLNAFISVVALTVGAAQMVFLFNLISSLFNGREAGGNPWRATTLEWQTPETPPAHRSEEHTSELQSLMRISYAVFCLKKKNTNQQ